MTTRSFGSIRWRESSQLSVWEVRGQTTLAEHAIVLVKNHTPQLLVAGIDVGGNAVDDLNWIRRARELVVGLRVVVWSSVDESRAVKAAFEAGAAA